jgi:hypothetical protein
MYQSHTNRINCSTATKALALVLVTSEYNSNFPFESYITVSNATRSPLGLRLYGASLRAYELLAKEFGYSIVYVVTVLDVVLVRNDLLTGTIIPPIDMFKDKTSLANQGCCGPADRYSSMWDYKVWLETKDARLASEAAVAEIKRLNTPKEIV